MNDSVNFNDFRLSKKRWNYFHNHSFQFIALIKRQLSFNPSSKREKNFPTHQRQLAIVSSKGRAKINDEKYYLLATTIIGTKADFSIVNCVWNGDWRFCRNQFTQWTSINQRQISVNGIYLNWSLINACSLWDKEGRSRWTSSKLSFVTARKGLTN